MAVCMYCQKECCFKLFENDKCRYVLKINDLYFEDDEKFQGSKFHTANWDKSVSIKALKTIFRNFSYATVNQNFRISFRNCFRNHDLFCGLGLECRFLFFCFLAFNNKHKQPSGLRPWLLDFLQQLFLPSY